MSYEIETLNWKPPIKSTLDLPKHAEQGDTYYCTETDVSYVRVVNDWLGYHGIIEENPLDKVIRIMEIE